MHLVALDQLLRLGQSARHLALGVLEQQAHGAAENPPRAVDLVDGEADAEGLLAAVGRRRAGELAQRADSNLVGRGLTLAAERAARGQRQRELLQKLAARDPFPCSVLHHQLLSECEAAGPAKRAGLRTIGHLVLKRPRPIATTSPAGLNTSTSATPSERPAFTVRPTARNSSSRAAFR